MFLTDLSQVFECIYHELVIATFNAFYFTNDSVSYIYSIV